MGLDMMMVQENKYMVGMFQLYSPFHPWVLHKRSFRMLLVCTISNRKKATLDALLLKLREQMDDVECIAGTDAYLYDKLRSEWCELTTLQLLSKCQPPL